MTTLELLQYYSNLLIFQYLGKPKAYATIQALVNPVIMAQTSTQNISFSAAATSGTFVLSYDGNSTEAINWNDSVATIQTKLQTLTGLSQVTLSGSISGQNIVVTFTGVIPPALELSVSSNNLLSGSSQITITILETDLTLPLAVQNGFNLIGSQTAVGVQLDVLAKYVGVTRMGIGFNGQAISLNDSDFLQLIKMGILTNNSGSSLYDIDRLLFNFFPGLILVFDNANMTLQYFLSSQIGTTDLIELFVTENLLPAPMGVGVGIYLAPIVDAFFGFITYDFPTQPPMTRPLNNYDNYQTDWPWFSYSYVFILI